MIRLGVSERLAPAAGLALALAELATAVAIAAAPSPFAGAAVFLVFGTFSAIYAKQHRAGAPCGCGMPMIDGKTLRVGLTIRLLIAGSGLAAFLVAPSRLVPPAIAAAVIIAAAVAGAAAPLALAHARRRRSAMPATTHEPGAHLTRRRLFQGTAWTVLASALVSATNAWATIWQGICAAAHANCQLCCEHNLTECIGRGGDPYECALELGRCQLGCELCMIQCETWGQSFCQLPHSYCWGRGPL